MPTILAVIIQKPFNVNGQIKPGIKTAIQTIGQKMNFQIMVIFLYFRGMP